MNTVSLRHVPPTPPADGPAAPPPVPLERVESCPSTNALALEPTYAERPTPFALATLDQRAGRGRQGRHWVNRPGRSLALTLVLEPGADREWWGWYPLAVALAAAQSIADLDPAASAPTPGGGAPGAPGGPVQIKWPNDLLDHREAKIAGILGEVRGDRLALGIGINLVGALDPAEEGLAAAGTVAALGPAYAEALASIEGRWAFAEALAARMFTECLTVDAGSRSRGRLRERYAVNCVTVGAEVVIDPGVADPARGLGPSPRLRAEGIDPWGQLIVREPGAHSRTVSAADVHLVSRTGQAAGADDGPEQPTARPEEGSAGGDIDSDRQGKGEERTHG